MFSEEQINQALALYHECESIGETVRRLGYPCRRTMYHWIKNEGKEKDIIDDKEIENVMLMHMKIDFDLVDYSNL